MVDQNLVGKKLGDYVLREKLTSGGMAHIYLGEDEKLQRRAAIKILTPDIARDDTVLRERFEREARAVAQLEHDSIVPIYQFGEADTLYFIAMRYIAGNDLADEIKNYKDRGEKMPVERMLNIMQQVASGLDHAHKRGIIHRDVKPSNILLRNQDNEIDGDKAVLTDFGLVLWEDVDKTLGTAFGTPRYISPEQATDSQSAVPQSDIYSLAVIVYEILTGEVLFRGNTPMEVALSHITEPPKPPRAYNPDIPVEAQREILKALHKDSSKRHSTALGFVYALSDAYEIDMGTKPPTAPKYQMPPPDVSTKPIRETQTPVRSAWNEPPVARPDRDEKPTTRIISEGVIGMSSPSGQGISRPDQGFETPVDTTDDEGSGLPLAIIGGAVVVIAILAAAFVFSGGADSIAPVNTNMQINYNEDFFAISNISENATLDISDMTVTGESGSTGSSFGTQPLLPGDCRFVKRGSVSDASIPDEWNCDGTAIRNESNDDIFWRAEQETDTHFVVRNGSVTIGRCDTAGRAVGRAGNNSCGLSWNQIQVNEE